MTPRSLASLALLVATTLLPGSIRAQEASGEAGALQLRAVWGRILYSSHGRHEQDALREALPKAAAQPVREIVWKDVEALLPRPGAKASTAYPLDFAALRPFLCQIHPNPRAKSHMPFGGYSGAHAVVLENEPQRLDLLFRVHVEFELAKERIYFTVSQMEGRLIVDPQRKEIVGFRLAVPSRSYNYDVHIRDGRRMLIDIGHIRELGVGGGWIPDEAMHRDALADARVQLRRAFYPFAKLDWTSFAEGLRRSRRSGKPLHLVTIFGQLDDESC